MNFISLNILLKGWWPFFLEEKIIIAFWFICSILISILYGLINLSAIQQFGFDTNACALTFLFFIFLRKIIAGGYCYNDKKLHGQTIIITGSNTGIGKETAKELARRGATIILACRDTDKAEKVALEIRDATKADVTALKLDLSSFSSIQDFAKNVLRDYNQLHCLINNAGVMMCPFSKTEDDHEMQMGVNHLGHFLLTSLLLPILTKGHEARIINVSSLGHLMGKIPFDDWEYKYGYNRTKAYANSKLANILHIRHLAKLLKGKNVQVFSLHPGVVHSELTRHLPLFGNYILPKIMPFLAKTTKEGAQTSIYCATEAIQQSTFYFSDCAPDKPSNEAMSDTEAEKLWKISEEITSSYRS